MTLLTNQRPATTTAAALNPWTPATFSLVTDGRYDVRNTIRNATLHSPIELYHFDLAAAEKLFAHGAITPIIDVKVIKRYCAGALSRSPLTRFTSVCLCSHHLCVR